MDEHRLKPNAPPARVGVGLILFAALAGAFALLAALGAPNQLRQLMQGPSGILVSQIILLSVLTMLGLGLYSWLSWRRLIKHQRLLRAAEQAGSDDKARYQRLLHSIDAGTVVCQAEHDGENPTFVVCDLNTAAEVLTGVSLTEALGQPLSSLFGFDHAQSLDALALQVWTTGLPVLLGALPMEKENQRTWYSYQAFKVSTGEVILTFDDITAQRNADHERQLLSAAVQQMHDAVIVMDHQGMIVYVNDAFETLYGYARAEVVGQPGENLLIDPQDPASRGRQAMHNNMARGTSWRGEYQVRRKDGEMYWAHGEHCPVYISDGQPAHWVSIVRDITERRDIEQRFRQVTKMEAIGQLAGGIAHDFNNLLTVINGYSQMALMTVDESDPMREDFAAISEAGERAAALVQQLLAFSRRQVMRMQSVQLNDQIVSMDRILRSLIPASITLKLEMDDDLGQVEADPTQMEQVIINLVANACDAMPEGGTLTISTTNVSMTQEFVTQHDGSRLGDYALLQVSDTGAGMPREVMDHIFEPFYTTKEVGHGTGLGLATVYGIIKQSQGYIYVESEVGIGSTFRVYMPLDFSSEQEEKRPTLRGPMSGGTETLLIAEDESIVRYVTANFMMRLGYQVLTASTGLEALTVYESHSGPIDMLIADVVMPEMNGADLAQELSARQPDLAVLLVTGYADSVIETCLGAADQAQVLRKPYDQQDLAMTVRQALDARMTFSSKGG